MKKMIILLMLLPFYQVNAQDNIPNKNLIDIVNNFYDLKIDNEVEETWYLYEIPGGKWVKMQKGKSEIWLPSHQLTKIQISENQIVKIIFENGKKQKTVLPLSFRDSLETLNIHQLPTFFTNPLIKIGCSSELLILIKCTNLIEFYELPICPVLVKDKNIKNFESREREAKRIMEICNFF